MNIYSNNRNKRALYLLIVAIFLNIAALGAIYEYTSHIRHVYEHQYATDFHEHLKHCQACSNFIYFNQIIHQLGNTLLIGVLSLVIFLSFSFISHIIIDRYILSKTLVSLKVRLND